MERANADAAHHHQRRDTRTSWDCRGWPLLAEAHIHCAAANGSVGFQPTIGASSIISKRTDHATNTTEPIRIFLFSTFFLLVLFIAWYGRRDVNNFDANDSIIRAGRNRHLGGLVRERFQWPIVA